LCRYDRVARNLWPNLIARRAGGDEASEHIDWTLAGGRRRATSGHACVRMLLLLLLAVMVDKLGLLVRNYSADTRTHLDLAREFVTSSWRPVGVR
jgi:hypothetical protein